MPKPNERCPCGSKKKYKKCCKKSGVFEIKKMRNIDSGKEIHYNPLDPTTWPNYGQKHPSYRFAVGARVRMGDSMCATVKDFDKEDTEQQICAYIVQLDTGINRTVRFDLDELISDINTNVRQKVDPSSFANFGRTDPKLRFSIGQRVEFKDPDTEQPVWKRGAIKELNVTRTNESGTASMNLDYLVLSDTGKIIQTMDYPINIRPLSFSKNVEQDFCSKCGKDGSTTGIKLLCCGGCRRIKYCSVDCMRDDRSKHKALCRFLIQEKERLTVDAKKTCKRKSPEQLAIALTHAATEGNVVKVKRLLKQRKKIPFDINLTVSIQKLGLERFFPKSMSDIKVNAFIAACVTDHVEVVDRLLRQDTIDINYNMCTMTVRMTALTIAIARKHVNVIERLVQESDKMDGVGKSLALEMAKVMKNKTILQLLTSAGITHENIYDEAGVIKGLNKEATETSTTIPVSIFKMNEIAVVHGLESAAGKLFNDKWVIIVETLNKNGRYGCILVDDNAKKKKKIKAMNLVKLTKPSQVHSWCTTSQCLLLAPQLRPQPVWNLIRNAVQSKTDDIEYVSKYGGTMQTDGSWYTDDFAL